MCAARPVRAHQTDLRSLALLSFVNGSKQVEWIGKADMYVDRFYMPSSQAFVSSGLFCFLGPLADLSLPLSLT